ncbi:MAG: dTDP-4-dehydrorhamnose reductase [Bacteroidetes bacterium]|nr:NAD(P)-dependent oxidoreductase [Rhodothermaceae bacterium RA]RMH54308.1 MAG: dTDP-4-dehydrorhamnose reductase [Bacteroidota bacterium]
MLYTRVLITGANGLVGQELVALLSRFPEYDVLATGRDAAPRFREGSCGYVPLDVTDAAAVRRLFQDFTPTAVINCAAMTQVDRCEEERAACWRVNVEAVETLASCCRTFGSRLIQLSTDFVFNGQAGPYREQDRPDPVNFYGRSKLAAENAARDAGPDRWTIVRPVLVYGTGHRLSRSNIALWVIDQLGKGQPIHVVTDQWRTPTYAPDLAQGIERVLRYRKHGIYHLSGREMLSVYDFARRIAEVFDLNPALIHPTDRSRFREPAERPPTTGLIILKAETELGYKPRPLSEALRHLGARLGLPVSTS